MMKRCAVLLLTLVCISGGVHAQRESFVKRVQQWLQTENDSNYIEDHTEDLTIRLFGSRKYTYYDIVHRRRKDEILYRPNSNFNVGVGVNYKFIGVNLGFNLPFINRDRDKYGNTKYLDLQSHLYLRKLVIDFYGQYYKGYYVANPKGTLADYVPSDGFPQRPDLYNLNLGLTAQYIFNHKRFSYRAAYLQNEYQKKSAGSFLLGGDIFGIRIKGDSSFIPYNLSKPDFLKGVHYDRTGIFSLAANLGYAYTFVYKQHFFVTLSLSGGLGGNYTTLRFDDGSKKGGVGLQVNRTIRASIGYNSSKYFAGIHYVDIVTNSEMPIPLGMQAFGTGNFRVSLVRRFALKKPLF
ncbi:DUF4421 domain-containing protein [Chitinophaga pendula]|uniref:DUF4421 domain-containing protein n=1 Tax=Chitinophaga TaxID=79328 RepID=UPI000BAF43B5|nr:MULTISPECIES: DUF4421 domain-containing protein [Chitinophaga]ASZ11644.1 hypothetical protein CK934_12080 [Chitinophaga sp. MD30]UCJ05343.1 DUF4421 domain-containing protein [Chitinophaga pendula]